MSWNVSNKPKLYAVKIPDECRSQLLLAQQAQYWYQSDWPHFIFEMLKSENRPQPLPHHGQFSIHKSFYCDITHMNVITTRSGTTMLCHVDFFNSWHSTTSKKTSIFSVITLCHTLYLCNGKYITQCLSFTNISIATAELKSSCHSSYTWWFNSCVIKGEHTKNRRAKIGTRRHDSPMTLSGSKKELCTQDITKLEQHDHCIDQAIWQAIQGSNPNRSKRFFSRLKHPGQR